MKTMKKTLAALALFITTMTATAQPMSYYAMRENARFLTDRMAYTLGIATSLLDDLYMINYDYICGVNDYLDDVAYGYHYDDYMTVMYARDAALRALLTPYQWTRLVAIDYFYRPISFLNHRWSFGIYAYDPYRTRFYYHVPHHYHDYRGGHFFRGMAPVGGRIGGPHGGPNRQQHGNHGGPGYHIGNGGAQPGGHGHGGGFNNDNRGGNNNANRDMNPGGHGNNGGSGGIQPSGRNEGTGVRSLGGGNNIVTRPGNGTAAERPSSTRSTSIPVSQPSVGSRSGRMTGTSAPAPSQSTRSTSAPSRTSGGGGSFSGGSSRSAGTGSAGRASGGSGRGGRR